MSDFVAQPSRPPAPGQRNATYEEFGKGALTAAATTLFTADNTTGVSGSVASTTILEDLWLCNTDSSARTITLYIVEAGGTAAANRAILSGVSLKANETAHFGGLRTRIPANGTIQGLASVTSVVSYRMSGTVYR